MHLATLHVVVDSAIVCLVLVVFVYCLIGSNFIH